MNDSSASTAPSRLTLPGLGLLCMGLLFGGLAIGVALGGVMPWPDGSMTAVVAYVRAEPVALQVMATAVFASSVPLATYAATVVARLRQLGVARTAIALTGGTL